MGITRRNLLTGGVTVATLPLLHGSVFAADKPRRDVPKDAVILTAEVKAKEGEEDRVKEALRSLVGPTRKEKGCIHYILQQAAKDKTKFMFYEVWASREALKEHGQTPHMKAMGPKLKGLTDKGGGVTFYQLVE
ncbi:MAG: putative quinol monooxygenase [Planctomycetota bacterium]|jgi:quinol monooxygenase YgiN